MCMAINTPITATNTSSVQTGEARSIQLTSWVPTTSTKAEQTSLLVQTMEHMKAPQLPTWTTGAKGPTIQWANGPTGPTHGRRERWGNGETFEVDKAGKERNWTKEAMQTCNKDRRANVPIRWLWWWW